MYNTTVERGIRAFLGQIQKISSTNVLNRSSNVRNNFNFKNFNSNNNDFRVGLTSAQGKLELLDSLDSKSSLVPVNVRAHAQHHVFRIWPMAQIKTIMGSFLYNRLVVS